jgi:hypothetical protein
MPRSGSMKRLSYWISMGSCRRQERSLSASGPRDAGQWRQQERHCFVDAIYVYLRARADEAVGAGADRTTCRESRRRSARPRMNAWVDGTRRSPTKVAGRDGHPGVRFAVAAFGILLIDRRHASAQGTGLGTAGELVDPKVFSVSRTRAACRSLHMNQAQDSRTRTGRVVRRKAR